MKRYKAMIEKSGADFSYWHTVIAKNADEARQAFQDYLSSIGGGYFKDFHFLENID